MSGLSGAVSFCTLDMKSSGSSGGGAEVGANVGTGAVLSLGMLAVAGSLLGVFPAWLSPFEETTATATAAPTAIVATAEPTITSSLRRRLRASDASASAAQSGVWFRRPQSGC